MKPLKSNMLSDYRWMYDESVKSSHSKLNFNHFHNLFIAGGVARCGCGLGMHENNSFGMYMRPYPETITYYHGVANFFSGVGKQLSKA